MRAQTKSTPPPRHLLAVRVAEHSPHYAGLHLGVTLAAYHDAGLAAERPPGVAPVNGCARLARGDAARRLRASLAAVGRAGSREPLEQILALGVAGPPRLALLAFLLDQVEAGPCVLDAVVALGGAVALLGSPGRDTSATATSTRAFYRDQPDAGRR